MMVRRVGEGPFGLVVHHFRGSAMAKVWPLVLVVMLTSLAVEVIYEPWELERFSLTATPFSLIGVALSIFLGFRNNACYDRYWEARKQWGTLVNNSRTWARRLVQLVDDDSVHVELARRQAAFAHALRMHLRGESDWTELSAFLPADEIERLGSASNVPARIVHRTGERLRQLWKAGAIDTWLLPQLEACLQSDVDVQGACERIKKTPLPLSYTILTHRIVGLYCVGLPFGLHDQIGAMAPLVTGFIAFAFLGLDAIGTEIEDPFEKDLNDLPLSQLSTMIEIDVRQAVGETDLPEPIVPVRDVVH